MSTRVSLVTLGCSKNLVDSEVMLGIIKENGYLLTQDLDVADIIIINTCGFIKDAKEESIDTIIELGEYKKIGNCKRLIVTGCLAERYKEEILKELPEVDAVVGTGNLKDIVNVIEAVEKDKRILKAGDINNFDYDILPRFISSSNPVAYVKIAEGCNNFCTYCIIPKIRGKYRSRRIEKIIEEVKKLVEIGKKEIILIAQDTTKYGLDLYGKVRLPELLDELNKIEGLEWIRLQYLYPDDFTDELIDSIKRNEKVVKYVDIPIQHINNRILKRMNRKTTKERIIDLINKLRSRVPNIIIRTTLIVGFPGETEQEFKELCEFVKNTKFDRLGVFAYSKEEDTPAANFEDQVDEIVKEERKSIIMEIQKQISFEKNREKIGNIYKVLVEEQIEKTEDGLIYLGRSYMDSPEIDGLVYIHSKYRLNLGDFVNVKIFDCLEYDLIGEIDHEFSE
ncbi:30S ribosomal protein S12 methylthiotransferase RimO [Caloranaerobacter azorensis]|uniref:Ribosomal protein uS12 methylthiotransferase RimO n=1 Tax=Caloranaerobacter azorensis TaxID=116090 RepID=A0A6P1YD75_9FIRM|nr:30S ribosomal protein S12 methylthiotransferase RimO [Caloranaerobacter azorensis]QIB26135.1 30S ribosomal protein S12 methylthiotransferase RimO [Caloranaerobacter azorensis]